MALGVKELRSIAFELANLKVAFSAHSGKVDEKLSAHDQRLTRLETRKA